MIDKEVDTSVWKSLEVNVVSMCHPLKCKIGKPSSPKQASFPHLAGQAMEPFHEGRIATSAKAIANGN